MENLTLKLKLKINLKFIHLKKSQLWS